MVVTRRNVNLALLRKKKILRECDSLHCVSYKSKARELSYKYGALSSVSDRELSFSQDLIKQD